MKMINVRLDKKIAQIIEQNAEQQGILKSRYLRSVIEKGLVIEHQMQAGNLSHSNNHSGVDLMPKALEVIIENVILTRKLIHQSVSSTEERQEILELALSGAKQYVSKQLTSNTST